MKTCDCTFVSLIISLSHTIFHVSDLVTASRLLEEKEKKNSFDFYPIYCVNVPNSFGIRLNVQEETTVRSIMQQTNVVREERALESFQFQKCIFFLFLFRKKSFQTQFIPPAKTGRYLFFFCIWMDKDVCRQVRVVMELWNKSFFFSFYNKRGRKEMKYTNLYCRNWIAQSKL